MRLVSLRGRRHAWSGQHVNTTVSDTARQPIFMANNVARYAMVLKPQRRTRKTELYYAGNAEFNGSQSDFLSQNVAWASQR